MKSAFGAKQCEKQEESQVARHTLHRRMKAERQANTVTMVRCMPGSFFRKEIAMPSLNEFDQFAKPPDGCNPSVDFGVLARLLFRDLMHAPEMGDQACRSIIESNCLVVHDDGSEARAPADMAQCWYNTGLLEYPNLAPHVAQALIYLDKRSAVERHQTKPRLVRFPLM